MNSISTTAIIVKTITGNGRKQQGLPLVDPLGNGKNSNNGADDHDQQRIGLEELRFLKSRPLKFSASNDRIYRKYLHTYAVENSNYAQQKVRELKKAGFSGQRRPRIPAILVGDIWQGREVDHYTQAN